MKLSQNVRIYRTASVTEEDVRGLRPEQAPEVLSSVNPSLEGETVLSRTQQNGRNERPGKRVHYFRGPLSWRMRTSEKVTFGPAIREAPIAKGGAES